MLKPRTIDFAYDYIRTFWELGSYLENIVSYISAYISNKMVKSIDCTVCIDHLKGSYLPVLPKLKNRRPLSLTSEEVCRICKLSEQIIRQYKNELHTNKRQNISNFLLCKIMENLTITFNTTEINIHILTQNVLDNHRIQLTKHIINLYIKVRLYYHAKSVSTPIDHIRQKYTKLISAKHHSTQFSRI